MSAAEFTQVFASHFAAGRNVVLHAPTGAGKSTLLPLYLLQHTDARILLVQPRQVAARAVARRVAELYGCELGAEVGYHVRFDRRASEATRLLVVTDGIALQRIQGDPSLEGWNLLLLDEFHERSTQMDLLVAFARESQQVLRDDLRIGVLSATLDVDTVAAYLDAARVEAKGRSFPLTITHAPRPLPRPWSTRGWEQPLVRLIEQAWAEGEGDVLVFLPGVGEILRVSDALSARLTGVVVHALYGALSAQEQDRVLAHSRERRIVLATNVAETSLTVPGVDTVVDSGWVRRARLHTSSGIDRLLLERVSQASAAQRAGRAGRVRAGRVYRAWTDSEHNRLDEAESAELQRVDAAPACMEVLRWQGRGIEGFRWYEAPPAARLASAMELLELLGVTEDGAFTPLGRAIAALPLHPRLGVLVAHARGGAAEADAQRLALLLGETDYPHGFELGVQGSESDVERPLAQLELTGHPAARAHIRRALTQLRKSAERLTPSKHPAKSLAEAVVHAYPDRVAARRMEGEPRALLSTGMGVTLAPTSTVVRSPYFVALAMELRGDEAIVRAAMGVEASQLPAARVQEEERYRFSAEDERVEARVQRRFGAIVLQERPLPSPDAMKVSALLMAHALPEVESLVASSSGAEAWLARYRFASSVMPDRFPPLGEEFWHSVLEVACANARSFGALRQHRWLETFKNTVGWQVASSLDTLAPERLAVPSGSMIALDYSGERPVLAVRLQELFGSADTPRIMDGRVPVLLHLLAPNYRPQQVTDDLAGFWARTYAEVRAELRARYPKHAWPENPLEAPPQRGARRRKG